MKRLASKGIRKFFINRATSSGILKEGLKCTLIDWMIRNETRHSPGPLGTMVKTTSILKNQHGEYIVICHYTTNPDQETDIMIQNPNEDRPILSHHTIDETKSPIFEEHQITVPTKSGYNPIFISIKPPNEHSWRFENLGSAIIETAIHPPVQLLRFLLTQDGKRYAFQITPFEDIEPGRKPSPLFYEPVTYRGRYLHTSERRSDFGKRVSQTAQASESTT